MNSNPHPRQPNRNADQERIIYCDWCGRMTPTPRRGLCRACWLEAEEERKQYDRDHGHDRGEM